MILVKMSLLSQTLNSHNSRLVLCILSLSITRGWSESIPKCNCGESKKHSMMVIYDISILLFSFCELKLLNFKRLSTSLYSYPNRARQEFFRVS